MIDPLSEEDLGMMCRVLAAWARDRPASTDEGMLDRHLLENFRGANPVTVINQVPKVLPTVDLAQINGWLIGRRLPRTGAVVVPVANLQVDRANQAGTIMRCALRVGLFGVRNDGTLHAEGWRFEIAEDASTQLAAHPYHHCQAIVGWDIASNCLVHPGHDAHAACDGIDPTGVDAIDTERIDDIQRVLQSHPAFPLTSTTLTGLAASVLATLYGASGAAALIATDDRLLRTAGPIRDDLDRLRVTG